MTQIRCEHLAAKDRRLVCMIADSGISVEVSRRRGFTEGGLALRPTPPLSARELRTAIVEMEPFFCGVIDRIHGSQRIRLGRVRQRLWHDQLCCRRGQ